MVVVVVVVVVVFWCSRFGLGDSDKDGERCLS
jgi:hypothetical protein